MTNKEAINIMSQMIKDEEGFLSDDTVEAHKMAIKALEQEPTTKDDLGVDAVNRKELLKIYEDRFLELQKLKHLKDNKGVEDRQMGVNYCINILREMPSVTPQQKTGHCIGLGKDMTDESYKCSECGELSPYYYNFCPHCGELSPYD